MAWVDGGRGAWEWRDETGQLQPGPMPSEPPPSAQRQQAPAAASAPPEPTKTEQRQAFSDSWYQGIVQPVVDQVNDLRQFYGQQATSALAGATAPRRADLRTPDAVAGFGLDNTRIEGAGELDPYRQDREAALRDMRTLLDRSLSMPGAELLSAQDRELLAAEYADQAEQRALSAGRSVAGGLAAVQQGVEQAMDLRPQLEQQSGAQAREEARAINADRMAAFRTELDRINAASGVTQQIGTTATAAFGQEAEIRVQQANLGLGVMQELGRLTGVELELDQRQRENLGRLATDIMQLDLQAMGLAADQQMAFFDQIVRMYGIDQQTYAAIRQAAISKQVGPLDVMQLVGGVLSGGFSIGAAAVRR